MKIKSINPKLEQPEIAKELKISTSTIQRHRGKIFMLSPNRISPSSNSNYTTKQKTRNTKLDDIWMTSNDLKTTSNDLKTTSNEPVKNKQNNLKEVASIQNNEKKLGEIFHENKL